MSTPIASGYPMPLSQSSLYNHVDHRVLDMKDEIYYLKPNETPILTILNALGKNPCINTEYKWMEDEFLRMNAGKCRIVDMGVVTGAGGASTYEYHFVKLVLSRDFERQAFEQSAFLGLKGGDILTGAGEKLLDEAGVEEGATGYRPNLFKVVVYAVDGGANRTLYVLPPNFYAAQSANIKARIDALTDGTDLKTMLKQTFASPVDIMNRFNEVWCLVAPTGADGQTDPSADWDAGIGETTFAASTVSVAFRTFAPGAQQEGHAQGSGLLGETVKRPRFNSNITQIMKDAMSVTNTARAINLYGGENEETRRLARLGAKHKMNIEQRLVHNGGYTGYNTLQTTFRGLGLGVSAASSNGDYPFCYMKNADFNSDFIWAPDLTAPTDPRAEMWKLFDILNAIIEDSDVQSGLLLVSSKINTAMHQLALESGDQQVFAGVSDEAWGRQFKQWITPEYTFRTSVYKEVLRGPWENYALWLDFDSMELRPLQGRDTMLEMNVKEPGVDGLIHFYLTELGLECHGEKNAIIKMAST